MQVQIAGAAKEIAGDSPQPVSEPEKEVSVLRATYEESVFRQSIVEPAERRPEENIDLDRRVGTGAVTFWRGRVALYAVLKALGIGRGDSVIVPGYTCFAVPSAVIFAGAEPVYADIDPSTFSLTLETIVKAVGSKPLAKFKAILIQHSYGIPAETHSIVSWARAQGIATIEDCAHVFGSRYRDGAGEWQPVGTLSDAAFFSSQWTKPVSTGLGGWVETDNPRLRKELRRFREQECISPSKGEVVLLALQVAIRKLLSGPRLFWAVKNMYQALYSRGFILGTSSREELKGGMPYGYAKRMSSFQQRLLYRLLRDDSVPVHRRRLKRVYDAELERAGLPHLNVPDYADAVLLRYPIRMDRKQRILAEAKRHGIELGDWYSLPIDSPAGLEPTAFGYQRGTCPEGELASREVVNLPMGRNVGEQSARRIVEFVKRFA